MKENLFRWLNISCGWQWLYLYGALEEKNRKDQNTKQCNGIEKNTVEYNSGIELYTIDCYRTEYYSYMVVMQQSSSVTSFKIQYICEHTHTYAHIHSIELYTITVQNRKEKKKVTHTELKGGNCIGTLNETHTMKPSFFFFTQYDFNSVIHLLSCYPVWHPLSLSEGAFAVVPAAGSYSPSDESRDHPEAAGPQFWQNWEHQQLPQPLCAAAHQCQVRFLLL